MKRKQKIEIEIDYPDGCELVNHTREHTVGRSIIGNSVEWTVPITLEFRPAWQWPAWLKAEWIAMDRNGAWYAYLDEPVLGEFQWYGPRSQLTAPSSTTEPFHWIDFTPPPCTDWRQSKRRRPS